MSRPLPGTHGHENPNGRSLAERAPGPYHRELAALAIHLAQRRDDVLQAWRIAVAADPTLTSGTSLPRAQLHDHIPALLVDYEKRLMASGAAETLDTHDAQQGDAAAHGLHRWQQGFGLAEVMRELGRLNECVIDALDAYAVVYPELERGAMAAARKIWLKQHGDAIGASTSQYFQLQQIEAGSHIKDLEDALGNLRELERQRAQLWQQAAHDLRGNLGVVENATAGLTSVAVSDEVRDSFLRLLDRNVVALHHLLDDVTCLARLQGGKEAPHLEELDVATVLRDLCEGLQVRATERDLSLVFDGPSVLKVQTDAVKIRRVTQNLVLNAIKYTRRGGVTVQWGANDASDASDADRWFVQIQDTGPGFDVASGSRLFGMLEAATDQARQVTADDKTGEITHVDGQAGGPDGQAWQQPHGSLQHAGEGIGLSIVKRLCELLDATVEVESKAGAGTMFRILFPRRYAA